MYFWIETTHERPPTPPPREIYYDNYKYFATIFRLLIIDTVELWKVDVCIEWGNMDAFFWSKWYLYGF